MAEKIIFLPGASGNTRFWAPVANRLEHDAAQLHMGWPGFGSLPADPQIRGLDEHLARTIQA